MSIVFQLLSWIYQSLGGAEDCDDDDDDDDSMMMIMIIMAMMMIMVTIKNSRENKGRQKLHVFSYM
jgi:hypothetical protein